MLSGNCTEALSIQANVTISCSSARLIKNGIAPLPFPLPALLKQYWYIRRGERVRVRGPVPFYATLGLTPSRIAASAAATWAARDSEQFKLFFHTSCLLAWAELQGASCFETNRRLVGSSLSRQNDAELELSIG